MNPYIGDRVDEVTRKIREVRQLSRRRRAAPKSANDIEAMKRQIRALSEHVDNLTYMVIEIEEGLQRLKDELKQSPTRA